ncbi:hypothetical protein AcV5_002474 [Taiwanofungus camphoratus]|nr:hypothetical protein AcV5_002474 [Antrodia cinnamomea]
MDISRPGEAGVIAWCNSVRFGMAKDPGRQFLEEQIQNGFDFLDGYLENVFSGPRTESVTELLKTPGRRKEPVRTRAAAAAAGKVKAVVSLSLEDNDPEQENRVPVNNFHKALLQAKNTRSDVQSPALQQTGGASTKVLAAQAVKVQAQKAVDVAPRSDEHKFDTLKDGNQITSSTHVYPPPSPPVLTQEVAVEATLLQGDSVSDDLSMSQPGSMKELSIIAEDDEPVERSRIQVHSPQGISNGAERAAQVTPVASTQQGVDISCSENNTDVHLTQAETPAEDVIDMEIDESIQHDVTSTSTHTFHSIPLDSPLSSQAPSIAPFEQYVTAPLPRMPEAEDAIEPQPEPLLIVTSVLSDLAGAASDTQLSEVSVPIRDEPSSSALAFARKPSLSQLGLPAPSPLHKSMRTMREPSVGGPVASATVGGKRSSWLVKAREAKALEATGKGTSTLGGGVGVPNILGGTKRKSGEMLSTQPGSASAMEVGARSEDGERIPKVQKVGEPVEELAGYKGKAKDIGEQRVFTSESVQGQQTQLPRALPSPPRQAPVLFPVQSVEDLVVPMKTGGHDEGVLDRFKRTVEGLGARAGKTTSRSFGGNAAAALAEAKAAAEARVAERNKAEHGGRGSTVAETDVAPNTPNFAQDISPASAVAPSITTAPNSASSIESERRLSVSDLVTAHEEQEPKQQFGRVLHPPPPSMIAGPSKPSSVPRAADTSVSTTPPNSPPPARKLSFAPPLGPVFSKPPVVFVAPPAPAPSVAQPSHTAAGPSRDFSFKLLPTNPFSFPAAMTLGVPASLSSSPPSQFSQHKGPAPLSTQTSKASMFSDPVFDRSDDVPAWMPSTQDTDYSEHPTEPQQQSNPRLDDLDDDDSWHIDEKFASNQMWTPFGFASADRDDTWSTLPSRSTSQKGGDTGPVQPTENFTQALLENEEAESSHAQAENVEPTHAVPGTLNVEKTDLADMAMEIDSADAQELESDLDDVIVAGKSTHLQKSKAEPEPVRSQSQQSMASTASSSRSQVGFFGQASRLVNSMLGGSKKSKPEPVKSLQLAAAAAKKQQEEIEKKAARLKEMENRRQLAMQRKVEEDKARALEEERKFKEETERRKREREEHTDKRPLRGVVKKGDEDNTKKRKIAAEIAKGPDPKKPPSKEKKDNVPPPRIVKPSSSAAPGSAIKSASALKSALKQPGAPANAVPAQDISTSTKPTVAAAADAKPSKIIKPAASSSNLKAAAAKGKGKAPSKDDDLSEQQPSQIVQSQMANRVKAQMQPPPVSSESIELPDINSEYSDSEDEDRPRTFDPPEWAQAAQLQQALQQQSTLNPDDIFGRIGPLKMEEIFRTRQSRFRARTSSANWTGTDQLTAEEEREYVRRMGFK